jgi:hypothetical protein
MEKNKYSFEYEGKSYNLRDSVELFALGICEELATEKQRTSEVLQKCKILDSLSNALNEVSK